MKIVSACAMLLLALNVSAQNVGIGTTAPQSILHLRTSSTTNFRIDGSLPVITFSQGTEAGGYSSSGRLFGTSSGITLGTPLGTSDKVINFQVAGANRAMFDEGGNFKTREEIRLTASDFSDLGFLQLSGNDMRLGTVSGNSTGNLIFRVNGLNAVKVLPDGDLVPEYTIQFQNAGVNTAFVQRSGNDLRMGVNSGNSDGEIVMRLNGGDKMRLTNSGRLSLINSTTPTLYLNDGVSNKAYLQLQGINVQLRAPGGLARLGDDLTVNDVTSYVGIGTTAPEYKLHVAGSGVIKTNAGKVLNSANDNMLPVAFGTFDGSGNKLNGSSNISGGWIGKEFLLTVAGVNSTQSSIIVTVRNAKLTPSWNPSGDKFYLTFWDGSGDMLGPVSFSFAVFKAN